MIPQNKANPFDREGKKYFDLLTIYLENNKVPNSIKKMTSQIEFLSRNYGSGNFTSRSAGAFTPQQVALIMGDPVAQLKVILENSSLSSEVKYQLLNFFQMLLEKQKLDYHEVYNYIISYESEIIGSTTLKKDEKETILTVSSISTYALYVDSKHKDRDWETSVGNREVEPLFNTYQASVVSVIALMKMLY